MRVWTAAAITAIYFLTSGAGAQNLKEQAPTTPATPKTKLEAFTGETGAVIVKGYTDVGTVRAVGSIEVSAMTLRNAKLGQENKGLSISITEAGAYSRANRAFIDYEEISELLLGIEYVSKADTTVTKLANFEAIYSTKGNFKVTVFNNSSGQNQAHISTGNYSSGIFMKMSDLSKLREHIEVAKNILDNPDAVAAKGARVSPPTVPSSASAAAESNTTAQPKFTNPTTTPPRTSQPLPAPGNTTKPKLNPAPLNLSR